MRVLLAKEKATSKETARSIQKLLALALTGFEAALCFVDHINTALTTHNAAIAVTLLQRAERVFNLHRFSPLTRRCVRLDG